MIVPHVLLITCGLAKYLLKKPEFLPPGYNSLLDWQIKQIQTMKRYPIILLGEDGDDFLRQAKNIHHCEMAVAPLGAKTLTAFIQAGFEQTGHKAFALPGNIPCPPAYIWEQLELKYDDLPEAAVPHIIRPIVNEKSQYPYFVTLRGSRYIARQDKNIELMNLPELDVLDLNIKTPEKSHRINDDKIL